MAQENIKTLDDLDITTNIMANINSTALGKGSGDAGGRLYESRLNDDRKRR